MDVAQRPSLISLLKSIQARRKLSLNAFAKDIEVTPSWLSRFYTNNYDPDGWILDKVAQKLEYPTVEAMINDAVGKHRIDDDLLVGSSLNVCALPLYLCILENRLPDKTQSISTVSTDPQEEGIAHGAAGFDYLFKGDSASDRLGKTLTASHIFSELNRQRQRYDLAIVPTMLKDEQPLGGVYQLATIAQGYAVVVYVIGKALHKGWKVDEGIQKVEAFKECLINSQKRIRKVILLRQTVAYRQWEEFCSELYISQRSDDLSLLSTLSACTINYEDLPDDITVAVSNNDEDAITILCAYEPFANTYFHAYFGWQPDYEYAYWNLSKLLGKSVEMALLSNRTTLENDEKRRILFTLFQAFRSVKLDNTATGYRYSATLDRLSKILFVDAHGESDKTCLERLLRSIRHLTFNLTNTELANYIFDEL